MPQPASRRIAAAVRSVPAERWIGLALIAILSAVVIGTRWGVLIIDTRPDLYLAPWRLASDSLHAWAIGPSLGVPNYDVGYLPVATILGLVESIGTPPWLAMRLWRLALYLVAAFGARAFYRDLRASEANGSSPDCANSAAAVAGRLVAAVVYVANPYTIVGATTTPVLLPYALFPWLLLALRRSYRPGQRVRGAAWFGLVFFAMAGINAGIVGLVLLIAVPIVAVDAALRERRSRVVATTVLSLAVAALVSAYWVVASWSALRTGQSVAAASESPETVGATSSFAEVLRGLGMWPLYGRDAGGPFRPAFVSYVVDPVVVLASFTLPATAFLGALLSRSKLRAIATGLVVVGATVMVGVHAANGASPLGRALLWSFENIPGAIAFRTTTKVGAVLVLGLTVLAALGVEALVPRLRDHLARASVALGAGVVLVASVAPALMGNLFAGPLPVPDYWYAAADDLDDRDVVGRVWLVPGQTLVDYRWGRRSVDDIAPALLNRPSVVRTTLPDTTAYSANFLAGVDGSLQSDTASPGLVSTASRYLGAGDVLVRHDVVWEFTGGARPIQIDQQVGSDPGLALSAAYGYRDEFVRSSDDATDPVPTPEQQAASRAEALLTPLVRYAVHDPAEQVRTLPADGQLVVVGDGMAISSLVDYGLLDGERGFRLATGEQAPVLRAIDDGARVVLTDTNRRRAANDRRLNASGPLLPVAAGLGPTRVLGDPVDQTVAWYVGSGPVTASASGTVFGPVPTGAPALAVDGDPATSWQVGDFGTAIGQWWRLDLGKMQPVPWVEIVPSNSTPVRVAQIRVDVGDESRTVRVGSDPIRVALPTGTVAGSVTVTLTAISGAGYNQVGLAEVRVPGVHPRLVQRLPLTLQSLVDASGPLPPSTPVDVLVTRAVAGEHEMFLQPRAFDLPGSRSYVLQSRVVSPSASPQRVDYWQGVPASSFFATSTRTVSLAQRPSTAFDGDRKTGWQPSSLETAPWLRGRFAARTLHRVVIHAAVPRGAASDAVVRVDGKRVGRVSLADGVTVVRFPEQGVSRVAVDLERQDGTSRIGNWPQVQEIAVGAPPGRPDTEPRPCVSVGQLDGRPIRVRLVGDLAGLTLPRGAAAAACGGPVALTEGQHELVGSEGPLVAHSVYLADQTPDRPDPTSSTDAPTVVEWSRTQTSFTVSLPASSDPYDLALAEAYDPRWHASATPTEGSGRVDLGVAEPINGAGMGWRIAAGPAQVVTVAYQPQLPLLIGLAASAFAVAGCFGVVCWSLVRSRRRPT